MIIEQQLDLSSYDAIGIRDGQHVVLIYDIALPEAGRAEARRLLLAELRTAADPAQAAGVTLASGTCSVRDPHPATAGD